MPKCNCTTAELLEKAVDRKRTAVRGKANEEHMTDVYVCMCVFSCMCMHMYSMYVHVCVCTCACVFDITQDRLASSVHTHTLHES